MDLNGPALAPPDGQESNFDNPDNQNALAWGVLMACAVVSTASVLFRAYARVYLLRKIQAEEILILLGYGAFWGALYAEIQLIYMPGYFVHTWNVKLGDVIPTTYWILIFGTCYSFVLPLVKIAIMIEWIRIFVPRANRMSSPFYWGCMFVSFIQVGAGIGVVVSLNMECIPHEAIWDFTIARECFDLHKLQVASASIHLACDIIMMILPQRIIWTLNMSWKKRMGVSVVFGLGLIACISASFRLSTTVTYGKSPDSLYSMGPLLFWATAEMACGFFIVCVPCIPKILKDKGIVSRVKRLFGMSVTTSPSKGLDAYGSNTMNSKLASTTSNAYYKLDERGVQMDNLKSTESTEHLREDQKAHGGITRITRITVTKEARSGSDSDSVEQQKGDWR